MSAEPIPVSKTSVLKLPRSHHAHFALKLLGPARCKLAWKQSLISRGFAFGIPASTLAYHLNKPFQSDGAFWHAIGAEDH